MNSEFEKIFSELCSLNGGSGAEDEVRNYIADKISGSCESVIVNKAGCIIAEKKGRKKAESRCMISAHMDEVSLIVTHINDDGTMQFDTVGGVSPDVCAGRKVTVNGRNGVIGTVAVHHLSKDEMKKPVALSALHIDIGTHDREETEKYVSLGDYVYFAAGYESGNGYVTSKAIDDRAGCAIMIDMICNDLLEYDAVFTFVTREEIGLRGAGTAAYDVDPDLAIVLEATTAADIPIAHGDKKCCFLGRGAVVSYMDRSTVYDRELYNTANRLAEENNIPVQTKLVVAGGNDSGVIHVTRGGIRTAAISVPCRYLHSPSCKAMSADIESCERLAVLLADHCSAVKK